MYNNFDTHCAAVENGLRFPFGVPHDTNPFLDHNCILNPILIEPEVILHETECLPLV